MEGLVRIINYAALKLLKVTFKFIDLNKSKFAQGPLNDRMCTMYFIVRKSQVIIIDRTASHCAVRICHDARTLLV